MTIRSGRPARQSLVHEAFRRQQVTMLAEEELDRVAQAVDGAVEVHPPATDPDTCLDYMPFAANARLRGYAD